MPTKTSPMGEVDSKDINAHRIAILAAISKQDDEQTLRTLGWFLEIMEMNQGNAATPIMDFIVELPWRWKLSIKYGNGLTPDDLTELINGEDGCRGWFDDAIRASIHFKTYYADAISAAANGRTGNVNVDGKEA